MVTDPQYSSHEEQRRTLGYRNNRRITIDFKRLLLRLIGRNLVLDAMLEPFLIKELAYCKASFHTKSELHHCMYRLYSKTNGTSHERLFNRLCRGNPKRLLQDLRSMLDGQLIKDNILERASNDNADDTEALLTRLKDRYIFDGYIDFPYIINASLIDALVLDLINSPEAIFKCRDQSSCLPGLFRFQDLKPGIVVAKTGLDSSGTRSIIKSSIANKLDALTEFFMLLAKYLMQSNDAILKHRSAWWSFPSDEPSSVCAQQFHYDCDSIKWVKFFVYMSDVGARNGPHTAIKCTHTPKSKDWELVRSGYVRHSDEKIMSSLGSNQVKETFTRAKGSIIIGDTRCWHKGERVIEGTRIMADFVFLCHPLSLESQ